MFTGIVHRTGQITAIKKQSKGVLLSIVSDFNNLILGESIAVDGVCLTVINFFHGVFECELSPETLSHSIASSYVLNQLVNLERALSLQDRLSGHFVTGHVDCKIVLSHKSLNDRFLLLEFSLLSSEDCSYLVRKGSVTINGVSLTVNAVYVEKFSVMLIPYTLEQTNLNTLSIGDEVNVEWDYLAKLVEQRLDA